MTDARTNRYGDTIAVGQHWLDPAARDNRRTLRVDGFEDAGSLGTVAVCTVVAVHDQRAGTVTHPDRVVQINVDRLHTTAAGKGYQLAAGAMTVRVADWRTSPVGHADIRTVTIDAVCPTCSGPRGVPATHNIEVDGQRLSCDTWDNPCGHTDRYHLVLAEAERIAAAVSAG
ncbi:hypothetical protein [Prescottella subtropica]|uniref:hypothetical protein n=1 Tax=Prescottella subtropica TaxID=2545757 RepID=UPI0010FA5258|nr:hypothetical protein [Prescottella subtropica]